MRDDPEQKEFFQNFDIKWYLQSEMVLESFDWNKVADYQQQQAIVDEQDEKRKEAYKKMQAQQNGAEAGADATAVEATNTPVLRISISREEDDAEGAMWHISRLIPDADKVRLNGGKDKQYILVGEAFGFPDYRDNPVYFSSIRQSYLWLDPSSAQPKILVQLGRCFPPLLWMPLKPQADSLKRFFEEFSTIEAHAVAHNVQWFEEMLQAIRFKELASEEKHQEVDLHKKTLEYLNSVDPDTLPDDEHEQMDSYFLGNIADIKVLEENFMNNPFVFNTPILLGSSNKYMSGLPIQFSKFRTVYSRSTITFEVRNDLRLELGDGGHTDKDSVLPVFVRINYPRNTRLSKPIPSRMNKLFLTDYADDVPVDVVAALFGNAMRSHESISRDFEELYERTGEVDAYSIAHLAILRYPKFDNIFDRFYRHEDPVVRLSCLKGAAEMGLKDRVLMLQQVETKEDILQMIEGILNNWDARAARKQMKQEEYVQQQRERAEKLMEDELKRQNDPFEKKKQTQQTSTSAGEQLSLNPDIK